VVGDAVHHRERFAYARQHEYERPLPGLRPDRQIAEELEEVGAGDQQRREAMLREQSRELLLAPLA
jgi:hypothetical protein